MAVPSVTGKDALFSQTVHSPGALVVKGGKLYRKVGGRQWLNSRRIGYGWIAEHRRVWAEHNGPIARGYQVHPRDGNYLNCAIENLYSVSPQERDGLRTSYPPELREVIVLSNRLKGMCNGKEQIDRPA